MVNRRLLMLVAACALLAAGAQLQRLRDDSVRAALAQYTPSIDRAPDAEGVGGASEEVVEVKPTPPPKHHGGCMRREGRYDCAKMHRPANPGAFGFE